MVCRDRLSYDDSLCVLRSGSSVDHIRGLQNEPACSAMRCHSLLLPEG